MKDTVDTRPFRGFCLGVPKQGDFPLFKELVSEVLPEHGCNALVLLIRYRYEFKSHPEVIDHEPLTAGQARELAAICRENNIRLIPKMNLLGHQSEKKGAHKMGLLRAYPDMDETPEAEELRYCRSLCPRHPKVKGIVSDLTGELIETFEADALHVGLDEVFEIGLCPRCKGTPNSELFAGWVNTLHECIVKKNKAEMLMWGDRLLDDKKTGYGEWESAINDTGNAIDNVPKDIIICDWHYAKMDKYPSVGIFPQKGFRMVACPWREPEATEAFVRYALKNGSEKVLGALATSWCDSGQVARYLVNGDNSVPEIPRQVGESFKKVMEMAG